MDVLVSGASIAGPTVAYWLARAGHRVTVVERAPELRTGGQNIDVRGPGREVLRRMGLEDAVLADSTGETRLRFVDEHHVLAEFPAGIDDSGGATAQAEILRGTLSRLLVDGAPATFLSRDPQLLGLDAAAQREAISAAISDAGWQAPRICAALANADEVYLDYLAQVRMPSWSRGRVVLCGDAALRATPLSGMGTTLALTGGYPLAREILRAATVAVAVMRKLIGLAGPRPARRLTSRLSTPVIEADQLPA